MADLWKIFPIMAEALLDKENGFPDAHILTTLYPDPLMRTGSTSAFCGKKSSNNESFLRLLSNVWPLEYVASFFGKKETTQEMSDIRDDFVLWLTGTVANNIHSDTDWEVLGLRGINIGIQCMLANEQRPFLSGNQLINYTKSNSCNKFWGLNGFSKFANTSWRFVALRNEDQRNNQLNGYVTNGYCRSSNDVTGRWFRVLGDALRLSDYHGTLHPNIGSVIKLFFSLR